MIRMRSLAAVVACLTLVVIVILLRSTQPDWPVEMTIGMENDPRPVIFNSDHHPAPATDARQFLEQLGVKFLHFDMSPTDYCRRFGTCNERKHLKVLNGDNMFYLDHSLIPKFFDAYKDDPVMRRVDAFLCYDPPAICELFEPFNKSLIIIASNRYYVGRESTDAWRTWNTNLQRYAADLRNFIGANNLYDANVIRFFTGIESQLIPSYTGYTSSTYSPTRKEFVIAKRRRDPEFANAFLQDFNHAASESKLGTPRLVKCESLYREYKHSDLAKHPGIVHIPYQVSTMSIFEHYRMNIPLFFPSQALMLRWCKDHNVLNDRVRPFAPVDEPPHPSQAHIPHPNETKNMTAVQYWIQFADYYTMPHIIYFESAAHLVELLQTITAENLKDISRKMAEYNRRSKSELLQKWRRVVTNIDMHRSRTNLTF